jgi:hypothetical protein
MKTKDVKSEWALVVIHWRDAFDGENGWTDLDKYTPEDTTVVTVGWLVPDMLANYVTVVNSYFPDEVEDPKTIGMPIHIPIGMVIKTIVIEKPTDVLQYYSDSPQESPSSQKPASPFQDYQPSLGKSQSEASLLNLPHE